MSDNNSDLVFFSNTYKGLLLLSTGWESGTISNESSKRDIILVSIINTKEMDKIKIILKLRTINTCKITCLKFAFVWP